MDGGSVPEFSIKSLIFILRHLNSFLRHLPGSGQYVNSIVYNS